MNAGTEKISRPSRRLRGVDAARAVAVLGMVMVHFGPTPAPDTALGALYELPHGRASVLFVLLAGVGWPCWPADPAKRCPGAGPAPGGVWCCARPCCCPWGCGCKGSTTGYS